MSSTEHITPRGSIKALTEKSKKDFTAEIHVNADDGQVNVASLGFRC